jgi:hypothetical protein
MADKKNRARRNGVPYLLDCALTPAFGPQRRSVIAILLSMPTTVIIIVVIVIVLAFAA